MSTIRKLTNEETTSRIAMHPQWQFSDNKLYRRLVFEDFIHAFGFITQVAMLAEKANHHPEWANVYRTVDIFLTTHEVDGVSERDFALLEKIERIIN